MATQHTPAFTPLSIEWTSKAEIGFDETLEALEKINPAASYKLSDTVEEVLDKIREFPNLYKAGRVDGTREVHLRSHILVYKVEPTTILVVGVFHERQNWFDI